MSAAMDDYQPDHYRLLGVSVTADAERLRDSYRRLSRIYHPDRQGGARAATVRFQQIAAAYAELSNRGQRESYDRSLLLQDPLRFVEDPRAERALDVLDGVFSRLRGRPQKTITRNRGRDLRVHHTITWRRAALGGEISVSAQYRTTCPTCHGRRTLEPARNPTCHVCAGRGTLQIGLRRQKLKCAFCEGQGSVLLAPCEGCDGEGEVTERRDVPVRVPSRSRDQSVLRLRRRGERAPNGGEDGDLVVVLTIAPHPLFEGNGDDVICPLPLTWLEAIGGGLTTVPTLEGSETLRLPPGLQSGQELRITGRGLPRAHGRGDLRYLVQIDTPKLDLAQFPELRHAIASLDEEVFERHANLKRIATASEAGLDSPLDQKPTEPR